MKDLAPVREKIDKIDEQIVALLNKRAGLALKVAEIKRKTDSPVYIPARENAILKRVCEMNAGPLSDKALQGVFREIFSATRSVEKDIKIACLGPEGTFSHLAALQQFGSSSLYLAEPGIDTVFRDVEKQIADFGVVPIENTLEGSISQSLDLLIESDVKVFAEIYFQVHHNLLSKAADIQDIKTLYSHYMPLGQCKNWVARNMPNVKIVDTSSSSDACIKALDDPDGAAIGAAQAAEIYRLPILANRIEDRTGNQTRFFVISYQEAAPTGQDKTSVLFSIKDSVGALHKIIKPFSEKGINLSKIQSRPMKTSQWEYVFFIDFDGHLKDPDVQWVLSRVKAQTTMFKELGSYPNARV